MQGLTKYDYIVVDSSATASKLDYLKEVFNQRLNYNVERVLFTSAFNVKDVISGADVHTAINTYKPLGIICIGVTAVRLLYPNCYHKIYDVDVHRGCTVPYYLEDGEAIPCRMSYSFDFILHPMNEDKRRLWESDLTIPSSALNIASIDYKKVMTPNIIICDTRSLIQDCVNRLKVEKIVAWDYETTGLNPFNYGGIKSERFSIAFAFDDGTVYAIPLYNFYPAGIQEAITEVLHAFLFDLNPDQVKVAHNAKFDMLWSAYDQTKYTLSDLSTNYEDTSLMSWLLDERSGHSRLKVSAWRYLGVKDWSIDVKDVTALPVSDVLHYNALDSFYTLRLYQVLKESIVKNDLDFVYRNLLLPSLYQYFKIELTGVPVNRKALMDLHKEYSIKIKDTEKSIVEKVNKVPFNPASSQDIQQYFIETCGYTLPSKTATGFSTNHDTLEYLVKTYNDPVAEYLLEYRRLAKLNNTYIEGLSKFVDTTDHIHSSFNLTATVTGRTSSSKPNMQNFPKRKDQHVRKVIEAPTGYKLCSFDYGQIEARLFAVITGDSQYIKDLYNKHDIHMHYAEVIYRDKLGWTDAEQVAKQRGVVKNKMIFPSFYGAGVSSISANIGIDPSIIVEVKNGIFDRYPLIKEWQRSLVKEEQKYHKVVSLFGRVRRSPVRFNELLNFIPQSTASDITLSALNMVGNRFRTLFTIHDDLSVLIKDDEHFQSSVDWIIDVMLTVPWHFMSRSSSMKAFVPLAVECLCGDDWANQQFLVSKDSLDIGCESLGDSIKKFSTL